MIDVGDACRYVTSTFTCYYIHILNKTKNAQQHQSSSSETLSDVVKSARRRSSLRRRNSTDELRQEKKQQHKPKLSIDRFLRRNASSSSKLNGKRVVSRSFANSWISDRSYSMTPTNKSKNVVIRRGRVKKRKKNENSHWKDVELLLYPKYLQYSYVVFFFSFAYLKSSALVCHLHNTLVSLNRNNINRAFFWAHVIDRHDARTQVRKVNLQFY